VPDIKEMTQMKKRHFDVETDGFYGAYWKCKTGSDCAMIAMIGDESQTKLQDTMQKIVNDSNGGLVCIII